MNEAEIALPRAPKKIKLTPADEARFWAKVNKDGPMMPHMDSVCWDWTAGKSGDGYGCLYTKHGVFKTHRISWVLHCGQISSDGSYHGICVCHRCDNRKCVNPDHLFLGTHNDNMCDKESKGRVPRGESSGTSKLTMSQIVEIRALHNSGCVSQITLAARFKISQSQISYIIHHKRWAHV